MKTEYTVVVAEDEELLLNSLVQKIEAFNPNFKVVGTAQTGKKALELVGRYAPDVLITDIRMPVMSGIDLLERVREAFPLIECIIISGFSDFEYARTALRLRVSDYLLKPIETEKLTKALQKIHNTFQAEKAKYNEIFHAGLTRQLPEEIAEILKTYILWNYTKPINLNLIASNMHYSPSYLTKIFQQQFHCTPSKYIISLRIQKAQQLLLHNPELSIWQVGEAVGYEDQGYFSRIFKKQTGQSPFDFRKEPRG